MKQTLLIASIALGFAVGISSPLAAQDLITVSGEVPFAFTVGKASLPAGHYTFARRSETNGSILEVRSDTTGRTIAMALVTAGTTAEPLKTTELVFRKIGNEGFLERVEVAGLTESLQLAPPRAEKRMMHDLGIGMLIYQPAKVVKA